MRNPKYINAIKNTFHGVYDIQEPIHSGLESRVLIARTPKRDIVCKFDHPNVCKHDVFISKLLRKNDIPVPLVKANKYEDIIFTTYDFNPNPTLADVLQMGVPPKFADMIYKSAFEAIYKMSQIPVNTTKMKPYMFATQTEYICNRTFGARVAFYHNDLHPGNILVSDDGVFSGILDINSITLGGKNVFLARTWTRYPADNFIGLLRYWGKLSGQDMSKDQIKLIYSMAYAPSK